MEHLGEPGSRRLLETPALECDLDALDDNINVMANLAQAAGLALRPHVKSHKSAFIAARQLSAGAVGLSFAKLSEAEAVIEALSSTHDRPVSALVTSPFVGARFAERAWLLHQRCDLIVVADALDGVGELASSARGERELTVLCDVDVGMGRTGVADVEAALRLVERIDASPGLRFGGVQGYAGNLQHVHPKQERRDRLRSSTNRLSEVIAALEGVGHEVALRTGGGTGSALIDIELGVLNELQSGSYLFMDREYRDVLGDDPEGRFRQSLTIATTVISANHDGHVTIDAGLKAMATDVGAPLVVGHETTVPYHFRGDEHGSLITPDSLFSRGERVNLVPPHCDPTVNLYDVIWMVRGDAVIDVAVVDARGCSQ
jgi:D-serine deaminase-like pyridoxal phosphate-dependent protein